MANDQKQPQPQKAQETESKEDRIKRDMQWRIQSGLTSEQARECATRQVESDDAAK